MRIHSRTVSPPGTETMTTESKTQCEDCGRTCENVGNGAVYLIREIRGVCFDCYGETPVMNARLDVQDRC